MVYLIKDVFKKYLIKVDSYAEHRIQKGKKQIKNEQLTKIKETIQKIQK